MTSRNSLVPAALLTVALLALGACSDSTTPEETAPDTTVPLVIGFSPGNGQIQVASYAQITVNFNEDMAPASATGQVTLTSGGTPTIEWLNARTFIIEHSEAWAEGVNVRVGIGEGITDVAGNPLGVNHTISFFTETSFMGLMDAEPRDIDTDVNRSTSLRLLFSLTPELNSLADFVTITDATTKAAYPFNVSYGDGEGWATLDPVADLPASTLITVTIGAGVHAYGSPLNTIGEAFNYQFTTGVDQDTSPPTILSVSPASGTTNVAAGIGALVIRFSEPIDQASFNPLSWNVEFALVFENGGAMPMWSEGGAVLTVGLPTLPAGLEMEVLLGGYTDLSGNVQNTPTAWNARVAGTADIFPMTDGIRHYLYTHWSRGLAGNPAPTESGEHVEYRQIETQLDGNVHVVHYDDVGFTIVRAWDIYRRLSDRINWLGFADGPDGQAPDEINFDSALKYLPLPMTTGTWSATTTVTVPGEGTYTAEMAGHVIGREDLTFPTKSDVPPLYYNGAWKVARIMDVTLGGEWFATMSDTTWYAPTLGPVREITREDHGARDLEPAGWYLTESWRDPAVIEGFSR